MALLLAPALLAGSGQAGHPATPLAAPRVIIGLEPETALPEAGDWFRGARVVHHNEAIHAIVVEAWGTHALLKRAVSDARVRYAAVDAPDALRPLTTPDDPRYPEQYGLRRIRAPDAWNLTTGSPDVVVAVLDSGVDPAHPDLGRLLAGRDFTGANTINDNCGHGTHVTGIAAATTANGVGIAGAAQVSILPVRVLRNGLAGCSGSFSALADGIVWAADQGARVISMSLGCDGCSNPAVADAVRYAAHEKGALLIAAAGNGGPCDDCVSFPANLADVMAIACTGERDGACGFSATGPEVDLAAPGEGVLSTWPGGEYRKQSGTSMSTPHVSGVAGLLFSIDPSLTSAQARDILTQTAKDLGPPGRDATFGQGLLQAGAAAQQAAQRLGTPPVVRFNDPWDGQTVSGEWRVLVHASADDGISTVRLQVGGREPMDVTGAFDGAHYVHAWDTRREPNGWLRLTATATSNGGLATTRHAHVLVDNPRDPPTVRIHDPWDGETVSGQRAILVFAEDEQGLASVQIRLNDGPAIDVTGAFDGAHYVHAWDTRREWNGWNRLSATATDANGDIATTSIYVYVQN